MSNKPIVLGQKVRSKITGFEGIATGRCVYITGCIQICVTPGVDTDGKQKDAIWCDEPFVEVIGESGLHQIEDAPKGGPQSNPAPTM